jgi:DNA-directed RNA polymerase
MIKLAEPQHLNKTGVFWLKVHIANVYGLDKKEFEERVKWVEENESMILAIADDPLGTIQHWAYSDSPYEFLAGCFAYRDYIRTGKTDIPIQLDATCSGIQIYSGLLLDREGAEAVNVIGNTRNDIYQQVADKVNEYLLNGEYPESYSYKDSEGVTQTFYNKDLAKQIAGKITRKIVKRNVMTIPYSVTAYGMFEQVWDILYEMKLKGQAFWNTEEYSLWHISKLITDLNIKAIEEILKGSRIGQRFIKEVVEEFYSIPQNKTQPVYYETPDGFPVLIDIKKEKKKRIATLLGKLQFREKTQEQDVRKILNGIAPNFIHSIDATLLRGVVKDADFTIGVIHDCFLCHPNNGTKLQDLYKDNYIRIMKDKPLEKFCKMLGIKKKVPYIGDLDLREVRKSRYIIS